MLQPELWQDAVEPPVPPEQHDEVRRTGPNMLHHRSGFLFLNDGDCLARNQLVASKRRLEEEETGTAEPKASEPVEQDAICSDFAASVLALNTAVSSHA